jgi:hypothetical protein
MAGEQWLHLRTCRTVTLLSLERFRNASYGKVKVDPDVRHGKGIDLS